MKLRNKKTGEIGKPAFIGVDYEITILPEDKNKKARYYKTLAELNEEWEDYEEPKEYWFIDYDGGIIPFNRNKETATDNLMKQIGNYFETKEEAEKAVEKLKAWKRLKDKGFRFCGRDDACISYEADIENWSMQDLQDFDLLFGGEK